MRWVEIRRHSFTKKGEARGKGSHLSQEGVAAARRVGARLGPFDYVTTSTSPRTAETALAMGFAVDVFVDMPSPAETGLVEFHAWRRWSDPFATLLQTAGEEAPFSAYLESQANLLLDIVRRLDDGGSALVVGHGGWSESVIAQILAGQGTSDLGGSFWHLDAVRLSFDDADDCAVEAVDRHPR